MASSSKNKPQADMRRQYDFAKGTRGKYASRASSMSLPIVLEPAIADLEAGRGRSHKDVCAELRREFGFSCRPSRLR